jgi:NitT/TauT family transport system permease protein
MSKPGQIRLAVVAGVVLFLEFICRVGSVDAISLAPPTKIVASAIELVMSGEIRRDAFLTFSTVAGSIVSAVSVGFLMGLALHRFPLVRRFLDPFLASYYSIPTFVFYPFFIVMFGLNRIPLMAIGFIFAVVAMAINTLSGMQRVPRVWLRTAQMMRMSRIDTIRKVIMPAAAPYLFTGLKLAIVYSFIGVIAGEFILSGAGLGFQIAFSYNSFETAKMYGYLAILLTLVGGLNLYIYGLEKRIYERRGGR